MSPSDGDSPPAAADCVLGLFAKWPAPGQVKTRLAAETSPAFAAAVAAALLDDALDRWADLPVRRIVAFSPPEAAGGFAARAASSLVFSHRWLRTLSNANNTGLHARTSAKSQISRNAGDYH